ncbi:MAG TPA: hypothetical protein VHF67_04835 [Gaiellaceae bacterium]|nr:hypothetical protein [Gaiellaceae bacterium]
MELIEEGRQASGEACSDSAEDGAEAPRRGMAAGGDGALKLELTLDS